MRKFFRFLKPDELHSEISEELRFHIEMKTADLVGKGLSPDQARQEAVKAFGSTTRIAEAGHDVRGQIALEEIAGDARFALRLLRKRKVKTAVLIATLAVGIGVNTAVFGVVRSLLLDPLPFAEADRLVVLHQANHGDRSGVSYPHFLDWRERNHSFSDSAVYSSGSATLTGEGEASIVFGATASSALFRVLGVKPLRGRLLRDEEDRLPSGANTINPILISDRLWRSRFGEREDILGQSLKLDGRQYKVVGIIPAGMAFPMQKDAVDYWTTVAVDADPMLYGGSIPTSRGYPRYDGMIARLRPGVTLAQAQADMAILAGTIAREHPKTTSANEVLVVPMLREVVGTPSRTMVLLLYGAVFCVLLVACVNVANILLVDTLARRREFSLRSALGARISKLVRQMLTESIVLAIAGGLASLIVAFFVLRLFVAFAPPETPRLSTIHLDGSVFFYVLTLSLVSGLIFGCLPALATRKYDLAGSLKEGSWSVTRKARGLRAGPILICGQIALSMLLTCSAAILVSSFDKILHSPRGFNSHEILTASISLPTASYGQGSRQVVNFYNSLLETLRSVPGVSAASLAEVLPLSGRSNGTTVQVAGVNEPGLPGVALRFVDAEYFATLQIPLVGGRFFEKSDVAGRVPCAIVNQSFVKRFLSGRDPYATEVRLGWGGSKAKRIVGVIADVRPSATSPAIGPEVYVPYAQFPLNDVSILIRASGDQAALVYSLRTVVRRLDASVPVDRIRSLDDYLLLSSASQQFLMWLLTVFAATTLLLSAVGLYGVLSAVTSSRAQEFGVRLALGASRTSVVRLVVNQALTISVIGLLVGSGLTFYTMRLLNHWIFDESVVRVSIFAGSGGLLALVVLAACFIPSQRAASIDPSVSLRTG